MPPISHQATYPRSRLLLDAPLLEVNRDTLYDGTEEGYTDYPVLRGVVPNSC